MQYLKYILFGGQVWLAGPVAQRPPVNFKRGAVRLILMGLFAYLLAPLLFVQSPIGFIPYTDTGEFSNLSHFSQYLHSLTFNTISISKSFVVGEGFPPEIPKPQGLGWRIFVSLSLLALNGLTAITLSVGAKRIYDNYQTYAEGLK